VKSARWWVVGAVGVLCGALLGWLLLALTGSAVVGLLAFVAVASILVVLSLQGMRQNRTYRLTDERAAAARARRARVEQAMRESRGER
jgi:predicted lipid-binding transport protein (Tim44 family)